MSTTSPTKSPLGTLTLIVGCAVAVAMGLALWIRGGDIGFVGDPIGGLAVGKTAPPVNAGAWLNGEPPSAESMQGKVRVVHGWFTACPVCWREAPELVRLHKKYGESQVVFLGLTPDGEDILSHIEGFLDKNGITWPNGYDARQTLIDFDVTGFPCVWVIDAQGKVVWNRDSRESLEEGIEAALAAR
jgi:thiol-disulfide isomerase/thioredoxin